MMCTKLSVTPVDGWKGWLPNQSPVQSKPGDQPDEETRWATRPEKTDSLRERLLGFGTAKAVVAPGAVTVHASTLWTPSQESAARA